MVDAITDVRLTPVCMDKRGGGGDKERERERGRERERERIRINQTNVQGVCLLIGITHTATLTNQMFGLLDYYK